jgi:hypothetical protein
MISGNMVGSYSQIGKTFVLVDENGNEVTAIITDQEQIFTATDNDVREGFVYASDDGVSTGTKVIPSYHTYTGFRMITKGSTATIPNLDASIDIYDYTKLQTIICSFNTNASKSVSAEKISIDDNVYNVLSAEPIATIAKNHETKTINLNIINDSNTHWILRFFTYKEVI